MKEIVWSEVLSVEVDEIDEDHHKLLDIFNILNHSLIDGEPPDYLAVVLEELINCTIWHFSHEERLMLKYDYEAIEEHKSMHQELIKSARELQHKILQKCNYLLDNHHIEHLKDSTDFSIGLF